MWARSTASARVPATVRTEDSEHRENNARRFCVNEWKLRTDPGYLRELVLARDKGICAICGIDTIAAWIDIKRARWDRRKLMLIDWGLKQFNRRSLWDADHIMPVVHGGGECDLDNMRTLCLKCHRKVTAELRKNRASR
jgi:5-methylcytosine-specific restriction enzyme A